MWRFFEAYRIMKLIGFLAAHPDVCLVKHLDPCCPPEHPQRQECLPILQYMNE